MNKTRTKSYLLLMTILMITSLMILSCMGCGGVKKGEVQNHETESEKHVVDKLEKASEKKTIDSKDTLSDNQKKASLQEGKKRRKNYRFNEAKAKQDAALRYPDHKIRSSFRGDSIQYIWADSKASLSLEYLVKYNYRGKYIETMDLTKINPYREFINYDNVEGTYHHMLGNNEIVNGTKEKVKGRIPPLLYDLTPDGFFISATNPYVVTETSPDKSKLLIRFGFHLLPAEEILEHQTYPGINTYIILDINTGEEVSRIQDLPFIPYYETLTNDGQYIIVAHTQDMSIKGFSTKEEDWKHQASVYNTNTGELCFRIEGKNECSTLRNRKSELLGLQCYDNVRGYQDIVTQYYLKDGFVISRDREIKEGLVHIEKSTKSYEAILSKTKEIIKYYYDSDFQKVQKLCK